MYSCGLVQTMIVMMEGFQHEKFVRRQPRYFGPRTYCDSFVRGTAFFGREVVWRNLIGSGNWNQKSVLV